MLIAEVIYATSGRLDDAVESVLFLSDCRGSAISGTDATTVVRMYFEAETAREEAIRLLDRHDGLEVRRVEEVDVDWLDLYEQSLEPLEIGRRWLVVPRRHLAPETDREVLVIPQERAFGTGSHATTALCLEILEGLDVRQSFCLDVGTGTGILAMALARLGSTRIVAFDLDPEALGPLRGNLAVNSIDSVQPFIGDLPALRNDSRFDLVVMNILPHVIIPMLPRIAALVRPGAALILSGVIESEVEGVAEAARLAGFRVEEEASSGEWWAGRFCRDA